MKNAFYVRFPSSRKFAIREFLSPKNNLFDSIVGKNHIVGTIVEH
jgi:hypothetical protein